MSARKKRVARLRDLMQQQERLARQTMARAEIAVREAQDQKQESLRRTEETLRQDVPGRLRGALYRASLSSVQRQDQNIDRLQEQLLLDLDLWHDKRQRAGSVEKLYERIADAEQETAERAADRELGDIVSSRVAVAKAGLGQTNQPTVGPTKVGQR